MNVFFRLSFLALALAFAFPLSAAPAAAAAPRIAVVDMSRVFREYYKSKIAENVIKQQAEIYRSYLLKLNDELRQLERDFEIARDGAQNVALSEIERRNFESTAKRKSEAITAKRAETARYGEDKSKQMREFELQKRKEVMDAIQVEVNRRAAADGYDFIFDISGRTTNDISALVYYKPETEITDGVIKTLNATATKNEKQ